MADITDSIFPLLLTRDVPVYSGTLVDGDYVFGIIGNRELRRIPSASLTFSAIANTSVPNSPESEGKADGIVWDESGVYTYLNGRWSKSPRLTGNWDDYGAQTRFLIVDKAQDLSAEEQQQGRSNLGLERATRQSLGLVQMAYSIDAGGDGVPTAQQVYDFVQRQVQKFGDQISGYKGEIHLRGPQGEAILDYNSVTKVLTVGEGIIVRYVDSAPEVNINTLNTIK